MLQRRGLQRKKGSEQKSLESEFVSNTCLPTDRRIVLLFMFCCYAFQACVFLLFCFLLALFVCFFVLFCFVFGFCLFVCSFVFYCVLRAKDRCLSQISQTKCCQVTFPCVRSKVIIPSCKLRAEQMKNPRRQSLLLSFFFTSGVCCRHGCLSETRNENRLSPRPRVLPQ